ncbi:hypothetical protein BKA62DRAFT_615232 [Auriculariales sp. MPI-PUGE-AT-0066]|nr:hypothetical protein BKA62DRAFT_615232 [Auriculariales sp. MPI-PUGE-AT-0066]
MSPTISPAQSNQSAYIPPPANGSNAVPTSYDATPSSVPPIQSQQTLDADQFLASLFVEKPVPAPFVCVLSSHALTSNCVLTSLISYSASLVSTTPSVTYRIPKKGSWEGALQLGMADGSSPPVFRVRIQEIATLRFDGNSQRLFSSCMAERQTLLLHKTFPASYLNFFFPALRLRVWAKMELAPGSQEDMPVFNGFLRHIEANHLFSLSAIPPKSDSDKINTHALVFHNSNVHLAKKLNLHQELASGETSNRGSPDPFLVFALLFPNADHPSPDPPRNGEKAQTATELWSDARRELNLLSEDLLKRTPNVQVDQLQLPGLEIPGNLLRFIHNQSYSVFERGHESAGVSVSQETRQLVRMLNRAGAKKMRTKDPALVIFIHLEHFRHLHSFPGLHHRRQSTSVQFWLYGTSPFYPPRLQGSSVIPVFPKGGVVTFTARIVAEKPTESQALISKINSHPDWVCYVIPEVVGLLQDMVTTEDTGAYKTKDFADPVTAVLALVKPYLEQQISVMRHPPPRWDDEAVVNWEVDLMTISDLIPPAHDDLDILDYCGKILDNHQVPTVERERFVYDLMLKDLRQMEATPAVHCNYRRFVIIVSDNFEQQPWLEIGGAGEDGFEKLAIDKFMFRDGFDPWMSS